MKHIIYIVAALSLILTGCDKTLHEIPVDIPVGQEAVVTVGLNTTQAPNAPLNDINLFWFDETDMLYRHDYYGSMPELAKARITLPKGSYTVMAVLNTGANFNPPSARAALPEISLSAFADWVRGQEGSYADMLTGTLRRIVENGVTLVYIDLATKSSGIKDASVELLLQLPSADMPAYVPVRSVVNPALRGVAHIFKKGTTELFAVRKVMLAPTAQQGVWSMGLSLFAGEYDVNLWVDYAENAATDYYYNTTDNDVVRIQPKASYTANSNFRDGFSKRFSVTLDETNRLTQSVEMHRPLAKYRVIATDVEKYEAARAKNGYPALENLTITVLYNGYLPTAYNIKTSTLADSETGYSYLSACSDISTTTATIAKDFVLVNGAQSSVNVTVLVKDAQGKVISGVQNVTVEYRSGQITTISGNFLTAGFDGNITIETDWGGEFDKEF